MKLPKILTKKLTSFWLLSITAVVFILSLVTGLSFLQVTAKAQQHKITDLGVVIKNHIDVTQNDISNQANLWLPPLLDASHIIDFTLLLEENDVFTYSNESLQNNRFTTAYQVILDENSKLSMTLTVPQYYTAYPFGLNELLILLTGLMTILLIVGYGYRWYVTELEGVEQLALRSKLILEGNYKQATDLKVQGRPRMINRAISRLLIELEDAHKERGRLDQFIRSNTFLDFDTQIGNAIFFANRLDALSHKQKMIAHGVVFLIEFDDIDWHDETDNIDSVSVLMKTTASVITPLLSSYDDSFFARKSAQQFSIVVPQLSLGEADLLANKLLKACLSIPLDGILNDDNYVHVGAAFFSGGDEQPQIIEEAEMALRAAQLQQTNTWFMYDKGAIDQQIAKGSVRWRTFLENALVKKRFFILQQQIVDSDNRVLYQEVFCRARDQQGNDVRATLFIPMANKCGLMPQIERQVVEQVLFKLMPQNTQTYCINLSYDSLTSRAFLRWIKSILLEHRPLAARLIFEVTEEVIVKNQTNTKLRDSIEMLSKMGAKLSVDHVGRQVVGTHYIQECQFDYVKLHHSIIKNIHQRPENQLFIRSLIGGLHRAKVQVMAEGVESFEEWQTLKILGVSAAQGEFFN